LYSYTYNTSNNLTEAKVQAWGDSSWLNNSRYLYTYNTNNNIAEVIIQMVNGDDWINYQDYAYSYDNNNNLSEIIYSGWDGNAWYNIQKYDYLYSPILAVDEEEANVNSYILTNNYPNPFNPVTTISFTIPEQAQVKLTVYDILGNVVDVLSDGVKNSGTYNIQWNAKNYSSGVYFYKLSVGKFIQTRKMILLK
jgi:hypothetical protein